MTDKKQSLKPLSVWQRIQQGPSSQVWTTQDFFDLGNYDSIKKTLQRLANNKKIRRIDRGSS